jgi:hypothetical protein
MSNAQILLPLTADEGTQNIRKGSRYLSEPEELNKASSCKVCMSYNQDWNPTHQVKRLQWRDLMRGQTRTSNTLDEIGLCRSAHGNSKLQTRVCCSGSFRTRCHARAIGHKHLYSHAYPAAKASSGTSSGMVRPTRTVPRPWREPAQADTTMWCVCWRCRSRSHPVTATWASGGWRDTLGGTLRSQMGML